MTPDTILREWFQKVWNEGDESAISRLAHPEVVIHGLAEGGAPVKGIAEFLRFRQAFRGAIPDIQISIQRTVSEGSYATGHCIVAGHHTGPGLPVPPSHQAIHFEGVCMLRIANGAIVEAWNFFDFLGFYQQVGMVFLKA